MRISDWSSDVCSSDLAARQPAFPVDDGQPGILRRALFRCHRRLAGDRQSAVAMGALTRLIPAALLLVATPARPDDVDSWRPLIQDASTRFRSEEHTSELQPLMRNSYAVSCLKKKKQNKQRRNTTAIQRC